MKSATYDPNSLMAQACEFRKAFNLHRSWLRQSIDLQNSLIVEEFKEFLQAQKDLPMSVVGRHDTLKELADLVYVCYQFAASVGWDLDEAMYRVHKSNMSKLGEDGKPIYRQDGKVLKGPNYKEADLRDLL